MAASTPQRWGKASMIALGSLSVTALLFVAISHNSAEVPHQDDVPDTIYRNRRQNTGPCIAEASCNGNPADVNQGGGCFPAGGNHICACYVGYKGDNCETTYDPCGGAPCQNGGTCSAKAPGTIAEEGDSYECQCAPGWGGVSCTIAQVCVAECVRCVQDPNIGSNICEECPAGKRVLKDHTQDYTCVDACPPGYEDDTNSKGYPSCSDTDECATLAPCQNGATCNNRDHNGEDGYHCECADGWEGTDCAVGTFCKTTPCRYGGTCNNGATGYTCTCTQGFANPDCQTDINECQPNPCQNGGTCTETDALSGNPGYTCACDGYTGANCETPTICTSSPCQNGGTCVEHDATNRTCACITGYTGVDCQIDIDECDPNPCQNSAQCTTPNIGDFECACPLTKHGKTCQFNKACLQNPCQNNGGCTNVGNSFTCTCGAGFDGSTCADVDASSGTTTTESPDTGDGLQLPIIIGLAIGGAILTLCLILILCYRYQQVRKENKKAVAPDQVTAFSNPAYDTGGRAPNPLYHGANDADAGAPNPAYAKASNATNPVHGYEEPDFSQAPKGANPYEAVPQFRDGGVIVNAGYAGAAAGDDAYMDLEDPNAVKPKAQGEDNYLDIGEDGDNNNRTIANPGYSTGATDRTVVNAGYSTGAAGEDSYMDLDDPSRTITNPGYATAGKPAAGEDAYMDIEGRTPINNPGYVAGSPDRTISNPGYATADGPAVTGEDAYMDIEGKDPRTINNPGYAVGAAQGEDAYMDIEGKKPNDDGLDIYTDEITPKAPAGGDTYMDM